MPPENHTSIAELLRFGLFGLTHPRLVSLMIRIRRQRLTYLGYRALMDLTQAVREVEINRVPGIMIEAGCALGGSAMMIASAKSVQRPLYVYDTFEVIPPPSHIDGDRAEKHYKNIQTGKAQGIKGEQYYGYKANLLEQVRTSFETHNLPIETNLVKLIPGLFADTLTVSQPVALAHLDCDWYESVMTCLKRIEPNLSTGGILIIDDYNDWAGCRQAVDEYFSNRQPSYRFIHKSRLHIQRIL